MEQLRPLIHSDFHNVSETLNLNCFVPWENKRFPYYKWSWIIVIIQLKCILFVKIVTDDGRAVAKLQGEDALPRGRRRDQDKSPYFSLSSHHSLRRNTNWDCSKRPATVCRWLWGLRGWLSVCLTARGRGLTALLHRQGHLRGSERK